MSQQQAAILFCQVQKFCINSKFLGEELCMGSLICLVMLMSMIRELLNTKESPPLVKQPLLTFHSLLLSVNHLSSVKSSCTRSQPTPTMSRVVIASHLGTLGLASHQPERKGMTIMIIQYTIIKQCITIMTIDHTIHDHATSLAVYTITRCATDKQS